MHFYLWLFWILSNNSWETVKSILYSVVADCYEERGIYLCLRGRKEKQRDKPRERERVARERVISDYLACAERSSFGSANARLPRRNRKLRLGFHLRCCASPRESWCSPWQNFAAVRKASRVPGDGDATRLDSARLLCWLPREKSSRVIKVATTPTPTPAWNCFYLCNIITTTRRAGSAKRQAKFHDARDEIRKCEEKTRWTRYNRDLLLETAVCLLQPAEIFMKDTAGSATTLSPKLETLYTHAFVVESWKHLGFPIV